MLTTVLLLLFFRFPIQETLSGKVEIYNSGAPVAIKAKVNGQLNLHVSDEDDIEKGELLGYYNWDITPEVGALLEHLAQVNLNLSDQKNKQSLTEILEELKSSNVPYLQGEISSVLAAYNLFAMSEERESFRSYVNSEKSRIANLENNQSQSRQVLNTRERQLSLLREHIQADKELLDKGILSPREYELKKRSYDQEIIDIKEKALSITAINNDIKGIEASIELGRHNLALNEIANYKSLLLAIDAYKKAYYVLKEEKEIISPISGKGHFADLLKFTNTPQIGEEIITIMPESKSTPSFTRIILDANSVGRVKKGNQVIISLDAYPIEQYGVVNATVDEIEELAQLDSYVYSLVLDHGLTTSYNRRLTPLVQLTGQGNILIGRTNIFQIIKNEILATRSRMALDQPSGMAPSTTAQQF